MCYLGVNMLKMIQVKLKRAKETGKNCNYIWEKVGLIHIKNKNIFDKKNKEI